MPARGASISTCATAWPASSLTVPAATCRDPSAGYERSGTSYSALADQLGSAHSYVSSAGVQSAITRWDPFGSARPGSSTATGIGYAGEWRGSPVPDEAVVQEIIRSEDGRTEAVTTSPIDFPSV